MISSCLLEQDQKKKPFTRKPFIATFKVKINTFFKCYIIISFVVETSGFMCMRTFKCGTFKVFSINIFCYETAELICDFFIA